MSDMEKCNDYTWQPARLVVPHNDNEHPRFNGGVGNKVVRIRPIKLEDISEYTKKVFDEMGCDATQFYELHPWDRVHPTSSICCEHAVLTD